MARQVGFFFAWVVCGLGCATSSPRAAPATAVDVAQPLDGPEPQIDPPALSRDAVSGVSSRGIASINRCHEQSLAVDPNVGGSVAVRFAVGADGAVTSAEVARSTHPRAQLAACVVEAIRGWRFPPPDGGVGVTVTQSFTFTAASEEPAEGPPSPPPSAEEAARLDAIAAHAQRGDARATQDALAQFRASFPRSRHLADAVLPLAELHFTQRRLAEARDAYRQVIDATGASSTLAGYARYKLAWTLHALDDHGPALAAMTDAIDRLASNRSDNARALVRNMRVELAVFVGAGTAPGSAQADALRTLRRYAADDAGARAMIERLVGWYREHQRPDDAAAVERAAAE